MSADTDKAALGEEIRFLQKLGEDTRRDYYADVKVPEKLQSDWERWLILQERYKQQDKPISPPHPIRKNDPKLIGFLD